MQGKIPREYVFGHVQVPECYKIQLIYSKKADHMLLKTRPPCNGIRMEWADVSYLMGRTRKVSLLFSLLVHYAHDIKLLATTALVLVIVFSC